MFDLLLERAAVYLNKLFRGHSGAISGFSHVSRIRFINGVCPAITQIDSLRPSRFTLRLLDTFFIT
jgi:hypothetical protein